MPLITAMRPSRRQGYLEVELDGQAVGPVQAREVEARGLGVGVELDEATARALRAAGELAQALALANGYLSHRPRTTAELRTRLRQAGYRDETIEAAVEAASGQGLLNDRRFAEMWVENRASFSPRSARALEMELRRKGVERGNIEAAIAGAAPDEAAAALDAGRKRLRAFAGLDEDAFRQRMSGHLARRGFNYEVIRGALEQLWAEAQEGR